MPKAPSNPPFKASASIATSSRSRRRSTSTAQGHGHDQGHSQVLTGAAAELPSMPSDPSRAEASLIPGSALDQDHVLDHDQVDEPVDATGADVDESPQNDSGNAFAGNRRLRRTRSASTSYSSSIAAEVGGRSTRRRSIRLGSSGGTVDNGTSATGPVAMTRSSQQAKQSTTKNSITGRFHFNDYASFGRDADLRSDSNNAARPNTGELYHHAHGREDDDDDGDDSLFPHSDSDGDSRSRPHPASTHHDHHGYPPQPYSQSQFHSTSYSNGDGFRHDYHPMSPTASSTGYDVDEPPTPASSAAPSKPPKRTGHPPLKLNLNDPNKSNLVLALEQSDDVDQDQLALLGPPSYEEMISDAILALDKADALRHNTPEEDHEPLGQKPADIFGYILTKFRGQLSTAFRGSATQALKKGLRRGRFYRVAPGTKPGYAGNGGYAVNKDYQGRTARGRAKKNHGSGVLGSPTSAKYAALQAARIAAINGDLAAAAVLEQARQQQMKTRKGGKKGGVEFDEWEALLAPPIPGVGYVMPPGMELEPRPAMRGKWTVGGLRKRTSARIQSQGQRDDDQDRDEQEQQEEDGQAGEEDGITYYDPRRAGGSQYAPAAGIRSSKCGTLPAPMRDTPRSRQASGDASMVTRSRPMRAARCNTSSYADGSDDDDKNEVQYLRRHQLYQHYGSQDELDVPADDAMDVDQESPMPPSQGQQQLLPAVGPKGYRRAPAAVAYASFYDPTRDSSPIAYSPLLLQPRRRNVAPLAPPTWHVGQEYPSHPHAIQPQMTTSNRRSTSPALHRRAQPPPPLYIPSPHPLSSNPSVPLHSNSHSDDNSSRQDVYSDCPPHLDSFSSSTSPSGVYNPNRRRSTGGVPPPPHSHRVRPRMGRSLISSYSDVLISTDTHHSPPPVVTYPSAPSPIRRAERERLGVDASFYRVDAGAAARDKSFASHSPVDHPQSRKAWASVASRGPSASPPGPLLVLGRSPEGSVVTAPLASPPPPPPPPPSLGAYAHYRLTKRGHGATEKGEYGEDYRPDSEYFNEYHDEDDVAADGELGHVPPHLRAYPQHMYPVHPHSTSSPLGIRNLADSATSPNVHAGGATRISRSAARASVLVNLMPLPATAASMAAGPQTFSSAPPSPALDRPSSLPGDQPEGDEHSLVASAKAVGCTREDAEVALSLLALFGNVSATSPTAEVPEDPLAAAAAAHPSPPPTAPGTTAADAPFPPPSSDSNYHPHVLSTFTLCPNPHTLHPPPLPQSLLPQAVSSSSSPSLPTSMTGTLTPPSAAFASTSSAARALVAVMSRSQASSPQVSPTVLTHRSGPSDTSLPSIDQGPTNPDGPDRQVESQSSLNLAPIPPPLPPVLPLLVRGSVLGEALGETTCGTDGLLVPARVLPPKASMPNLTAGSVAGTAAGSSVMAIGPVTAARDKRERGEVAVRAE